MLTKTKITLAAALVAGTASAAAAQDFDPNLANRYQQYASPFAQAPRGVSREILQSAPVWLRESRDVALPTGQGGNSYADPVEVDRSDRASSPYAGGGY